MSRNGPTIVVIGATGYTGRLVARELSGGEPFVAAARDPDRLRALAARLPGAEPHPVDVTDPDSLRRLLHAGDAVINTAGPFTELGDPVIEACIETGAHYLDTTGEQPWMREVHERFDGPARQAGVTVANAMAFEYALGDSAVTIGARALDAPLRTVDVIYAWAGVASSRGTRRTILRMLGRKGFVRRDNHYHRQTPGAERRTVALASGARLHAVSFQSGEIVTAPRHLFVDTMRGWLVTGSVAARIIPWIAPALPYAVPPLRPVLEPMITRGSDPTPEERTASDFTIRVELEAVDGRKRAVEVRGRDPYGLTARAAVIGAREAMRSDAPRGVLAPSQLVRADRFLASLPGCEVEELGTPDPPDRNEAPPDV